MTRFAVVTAACMGSDDTKPKVRLHPQHMDSHCRDRPMMEKRTVSGVDHGRESSNYLQGRTICAFCPLISIATIVQKRRQDRLKSREIACCRERPRNACEDDPRSGLPTIGPQGRHPKIPHQTHLFQTLQDVVRHIHLPPVEPLPLRRRIAVMVVMPPFAQSQQGDPPIVARSSDDLYRLRPLRNDG